MFINWLLGNKFSTITFLLPRNVWVSYRQSIQRLWEGHCCCSFLLWSIEGYSRFLLNFIIMIPGPHSFSIQALFEDDSSGFYLPDGRLTWSLLGLQSDIRGGDSLLVHIQVTFQIMLPKTPILRLGINFVWRVLSL